MSNVGSDFVNGFNELLKYGQLVRLKYYNTSYGAGSYYDDDISLTQSGSDVWVSGIVQPIDASRGSDEAILFEHGNLLTSDSKLYLAGSVNTSGILKIGLGSPPVNEYSMLDAGNISWSVNDASVVNKVYIRNLTNGSLIGE